MECLAVAKHCVAALVSIAGGVEALQRAIDVSPMGVVPLPISQVLRIREGMTAKDIEGVRHKVMAPSAIDGFARLPFTQVMCEALAEAGGSWVVRDEALSAFAELAEATAALHATASADGDDEATAAAARGAWRSASGAAGVLAALIPTTASDAHVLRWLHSYLLMVKAAARLPHHPAMAAALRAFDRKVIQHFALVGDLRTPHLWKLAHPPPAPEEHHAFLVAAAKKRVEVQKTQRPAMDAVGLWRHVTARMAVAHWGGLVAEQPQPQAQMQPAWATLSGIASTRAHVLPTDCFALQLAAETQKEQHGNALPADLRDPLQDALLARLVFPDWEAMHASNPSANADGTTKAAKADAAAAKTLGVAQQGNLLWEVRRSRGAADDGEEDACVSEGAVFDRYTRVLLHAPHVDVLDYLGTVANTDAAAMLTSSHTVLDEIQESLLACTMLPQWKRGRSAVANINRATAALTRGTVLPFLVDFVGKRDPAQDADEGEGEGAMEEVGESTNAPAAAALSETARAFVTAVEGDAGDDACWRRLHALLHTHAPSVQEDLARALQAATEGAAAAARAGPRPHAIPELGGFFKEIVGCLARVQNTDATVDDDAASTVLPCSQNDAGDAVAVGCALGLLGAWRLALLQPTSPLDPASRARHRADAAARLHEKREAYRAHMADVTSNVTGGEASATPQLACLDAHSAALAARVEEAESNAVHRRGGVDGAADRFPALFHEVRGFTTASGAGSFERLAGVVRKLLDACVVAVGGAAGELPPAREIALRELSLLSLAVERFAHNLEKYVGYEDIVSPLRAAASLMQLGLGLAVRGAPAGVFVHPGTTTAVPKKKVAAKRKAAQAGVVAPVEPEPTQLLRVLLKQVVALPSVALPDGITGVLQQLVYRVFTPGARGATARSLWGVVQSTVHALRVFQERAALAYQHVTASARHPAVQDARVSHDLAYVHASTGSGAGALRRVHRNALADCEAVYGAWVALWDVMEAETERREALAAEQFKWRDQTTEIEGDDEALERTLRELFPDYLDSFEDALKPKLKKTSEDGSDDDDDAAASNAGGDAAVAAARADDDDIAYSVQRMRAALLRKGELLDVVLQYVCMVGDSVKQRFTHSRTKGLTDSMCSKFSAAAAGGKSRKRSRRAASQKAEKVAQARLRLMASEDQLAEDALPEIPAPDLAVARDLLDTPSTEIVQRRLEPGALSTKLADTAFQCATTVVGALDPTASYTTVATAAHNARASGSAAGRASPLSLSDAEYAGSCAALLESATHTPGLVHSLLGLLKTAEITTQKARQVLSDDVTERVRTGFNIYLEPDVGEALCGLRALPPLRARCEELLEDFPEHPPLISLKQIVERVLSLNVRTEPLMKIVQGTELLLKAAHEWETTAHKGVSIAEHIKAIGKTVLRWRRLELHCWPHLLHGRRREQEERACRHAFTLWGLVKNAMEAGEAVAAKAAEDAKEPDAAPTPAPKPAKRRKGKKGKEVPEAATAQAAAKEPAATGGVLGARGRVDEGMARSVQAFLYDTTWGEFELRVRLLTAHGQRLALSLADGALPPTAECRGLCNLFLNTGSWFGTYLPEFRKGFSAEGKDIRKKLNEFIKIQRWEDANYYALTAATKKSHKEIARVLKQWDNVLAKRVAPWLTTHDETLDNRLILADEGGVVPPPLVKKHPGHHSQGKKGGKDNKDKEVGDEPPAKKIKGGSGADDASAAHASTEDHPMSPFCLALHDATSCLTEETHTAASVVAAAAGGATLSAVTGVANAACAAADFVDTIVSRAAELQPPAKVKKNIKQRAFKTLLDALADEGLDAKLDPTQSNTSKVWSESDTLAATGFPLQLSLAAGGSGVWPAETGQRERLLFTTAERDFYRCIQAVRRFYDALKVPDSDINPAQVQKMVVYVNGLLEVAKRQRGDVLPILGDLLEAFRKLFAAAEHARDVAGGDLNHDLPESAASEAGVLASRLKEVAAVARDCLAHTASVQQAVVGFADRRNKELTAAAQPPQPPIGDDADVAAAAAAVIAMRPAASEHARITPLLAADAVSAFATADRKAKDALREVADVAGRTAAAVAAALGESAKKAPAPASEQLRAAIISLRSVLGDLARDTSDAGGLAVGFAETALAAAEPLWAELNALAVKAKASAAPAADADGFKATVAGVCGRVRSATAGASLDTLVECHKYLAPAAAAEADADMAVDDGTNTNGSVSPSTMESLAEGAGVLSAAANVLADAPALLDQVDWPAVSAARRAVELLFRAAVTYNASSTRLTLVVARLFGTLLRKGFCGPKDEEEGSDDGEGEASGDMQQGTGMDDGEGQKDVTDELENEDQLMNSKDLEKDENQQEKKNENEDEEEQGAEVTTNFEGQLEDVKDNRDEDDDESVESEDVSKEEGEVDGDDQQETKGEQRQDDNENLRDAENDEKHEKMDDDNFENEDDQEDQEDNDSQKDPEEDGGWDNKNLDDKMNEPDEDAKDNAELTAKEGGLDDSGDEGDDKDGDESESSRDPNEKRDGEDDDAPDDGEADEDRDAKDGEDVPPEEGDQDDPAENAEPVDDEDGDDEEGDDADHTVNPEADGDADDDQSDAQPEPDQPDENEKNGQDLPDEQKGKDQGIDDGRAGEDETVHREDQKQPQSKKGEEEQAPVEQMQDSATGETMTKATKGAKSDSNSKPDKDKRDETLKNGEEKGEDEEQSPQNNQQKDKDNQKAADPFKALGRLLEQMKERMLRTEEAEGVEDDNVEEEVDAKADEFEIAPQDANTSEYAAAPIEHDPELNKFEQEDLREDPLDAKDTPMDDDAADDDAADDADKEGEKEEDGDGEKDKGKKEKEANKSGKRAKKKGGALLAEEEEEDEPMEEDDVIELDEATLVARGEALYNDMDADVTPLAHELAQHLRLLLEPSKCDRLKGDYKTGKRLNVKKVIGYIASGYKKDKIWMRRTKPSAREYQIVVAIDDSFSMSKNNAGTQALSALSVLTKALAIVEAGQLSVAKFGKDVDFLHTFEDPLTLDCASNFLGRFRFDQNETDVMLLMQETLAKLDQAKMERGPSNRTTTDLLQLMFIISDGKIQRQYRKGIKELVAQAQENNQLVVFVILDEDAKDAPAEEEDPEVTKNMSNAELRRHRKRQQEKREKVKSGSVLQMMDVDVLPGGGGVTLTPFMDGFPFPFYIVVNNLEELPNTLSDALAQWFEMTQAS